MKKMAKKCSTAQSFIRKEVTYYKIHTLVDDSTSYSYRDKAKRPKVKAKQKVLKNSLHYIALLIFPPPQQ